MPDKAVYFLVVEGFADWEAAHALAELRRHGGYRVETVGLGRNPVISMGGLRVVPSQTVADIDPPMLLSSFSQVAIAGRPCRWRRSSKRR